MASRGASLQFLSQFPHEAELLFPPKTMLECKDHTVRGSKRLVVVAPTVSTARPDTSSIRTPDDVPTKKLAEQASPVVPLRRTFAPTFALQCCIDEGSRGIRMLSRMLGCMDRFGKDLFLEFNQDEVRRAPRARLTLHAPAHPPSPLPHR